MPAKESRFGKSDPDDRGGRPAGSPEAAYASARARLQKSIAQSPEDGDARLELGSLASFAGDFGTAETHLLRAVELVPDDPRAHLRLGDVLYETARLSEAVERYREAERLLSAGGAGETPLAEEARLELRLAQKELDLVYRPLEEAESELAARGGGADAAQLNRTGCLRLAAGRIEDAGDAFRRAIESDPDSLEAALNLGFIQGLAMVEPSRLRRSVSELAAASEHFPGEPRLYLHLAELYEASSLYEAAVARIERALEVAPRCIEAYDMASRYVLLGGEYEDRLGKKIDEMVSEAEDALAKSPEDKDAKKALAFASLGRSRFSRDGEGDLARAREMLEGLVGEEGDEGVSLRLAECIERTGDWRAAERLTEDVASRPAASARAVFDLAGFRLRRGCPAEAVDLFAQAVSRAPGEAAYYQSLRYALASTRRLATAELLSRAELSNDPRSVGARLDLGRAYMDALKVDEAVGILEKAAGLAPARADVHSALGKALASAGRPGDAERSFRKALDIDPDSPGAHRGLGRLLVEQAGRMREGLAELEEYRRLKGNGVR